MADIRQTTAYLDDLTALFSSTTVAALFRDGAGLTWTNANGKNAKFVLTYQI